jgi:hypothetical protein
VGTPTASVVVTATSNDGAAASQEIRVAVSETPSPALRVTPANGAAPLSVTFLVTGAPPGALIDLDVDGDGQTDITAQAADGLAFVYGQPGLYFPSATFGDAQGTRRSVKGVVQVHDLATLDALLQTRWAALKEALRRGDVPQALTSIAGRARSRYEGMFNDLRADLHDVDSILTSFRLLELRRSEAIGEMLRFDGNVLESFEIRFHIDDDGNWRIASF